MPKISVIIPTYNRGHFLKEAINSVLHQTYSEFELIIVDDGSQDDTPKVVKSFKDRRIRYIYCPHQGVSHARNVGIKNAQGEFIAFLDSDDLWLPKKLEIQKNFLTQASNLLICQTEEVWVRNGRRVNPKKYHRKPSGRMFNQSLRRCLISPSAVMMHRRLFETIGLFDEQMPVCEDYDMWLRVTLRFPVYLIPQALVVKRGGHADQLSRRTGLDKWRIRSILKLFNNELSRSQSKMDAFRNEATNLAFQELIYKCQIYGQGCLKRGKGLEALFYLTLPETLYLKFLLQDLFSSQGES